MPDFLGKVEVSQGLKEVNTLKAFNSYMEEDRKGAPLKGETVEFLKILFEDYEERDHSLSGANKFEVIRFSEDELNMAGRPKIIQNITSWLKRRSSLQVSCERVPEKDTETQVAFRMFLRQSNKSKSVHYTTAS